jgi:hypothetical protein
MTFLIKRGDTGPAIEFTLRDQNGNRVDISGYQDINFYMRDVEEGLLAVENNVSGGVGVADAERGNVYYEWESGDTDEIGNYHAELEVIYNDGTRETFPNKGFIDIEVTEDLK